MIQIKCNKHKSRCAFFRDTAVFDFNLIFDVFEKLRQIRFPAFLKSGNPCTPTSYRGARGVSESPEERFDPCGALGEMAGSAGVGGGAAQAGAGELRFTRQTTTSASIAFESLSSLALFVAATFQTVSQRPSVISTMFLVLWGLERVAASQRYKRNGGAQDTSTRNEMYLGTPFVWRLMVFVSAMAVFGACVAQSCYAVFGAGWPHSDAHRLALKVIGFQYFPSTAESFAEITPFVVVLLVAAFNVREARLQKYKKRTRGADVDDTGSIVDEDELDLLPTVNGTGDDPYTDIENETGSRDSRTTTAIRVARISAIVSGVSAPSFLALPYFLVVVLEILVTAFTSTTHYEKADTGCTGDARTAVCMFRKYVNCARVMTVYAAAHFSLLYVYQLPELNLNANKVKAKWLGLTVLFDTGRGADAGDTGEVETTITSLLRFTQMACLALLFCSLLAAGAFADFGSDEENEEDADGSDRDQKSKSYFPPLGLGRFQGTFFELFRKKREVENEVLEETLLDPEDEEWVEDDERDSVANGTEINDAETSFGISGKEPSVFIRLVSLHCSFLGAVFVVVMSCFIRSVLLVPLLVGALREITKTDNSESEINRKLKFATRTGPLTVLYLSLWCLVEYYFLSVPGEALNVTQIWVLQGLGLINQEVDLSANACEINAVRVFSLFVSLGVFAGLTKTARMTPGEEVLERVFGRVNVEFDDDSEHSQHEKRFVRLDTYGQLPSRRPETLDDTASDEHDDAEDDRNDRNDSSRSRRRSFLQTSIQVIVPTVLWLVALTTNDVIHAVLLAAFVCTLWQKPGDVWILRLVQRLVAVCFFMTYFFEVTSTVVTGISTSTHSFLTFLGLMHPSHLRDVLPLALAVLVTCAATRVELIEVTMKWCREMEEEEEVGGSVGEHTSHTMRSSWQASWALAVAIGEEIRVWAFSLVDGRGGYVVLFCGAVVVLSETPSLLHLALLTVVVGASLVPDVWVFSVVPGGGRGAVLSGMSGTTLNTHTTHISPRWRFVFLFAAFNFFARYLLGAFRVMQILGFSDELKTFVINCIGIPINLDPSDMYTELFGPSVFLVVTHAHLGGWFQSGSRNIFARSEATRNNPVAVTATERGLLPFTKRLLIIHATKPLLLCSVVFAISRVDLFGFVTMGLCVWVSVSKKHSTTVPCEFLALVVTTAALFEYAFSVPYLYEHLHRHSGLLKWVGVEGGMSDRSNDSGNSTLMTLTVLILASLELVRASLRNLKRLPPALKTACAPEPCHLFWPPYLPIEAVERGVKEWREEEHKDETDAFEKFEKADQEEEWVSSDGEGDSDARTDAKKTSRRRKEKRKSQERKRKLTSYAQVSILCGSAPAYLEGLFASMMPGLMYFACVIAAVTCSNVLSLLYLGVAVTLMEFGGGGTKGWRQKNQKPSTPRRRRRVWKFATAVCSLIVVW